MKGLPRQVKPKELVKVALKLGFEFSRQKGSHAVYKRAADHLRIVIPIHAGPLKPARCMDYLKTWASLQKSWLT